MQCTQWKQWLIVDWAETCRCSEWVYMRGITWRLSFFIIIAAESFHPRWRTNSLAWHSCQQHNIRNWIAGLRTFTSGSKMIASPPKLILFRREQGVLILAVVQTGLVFLHLSYYTMNLGMSLGMISLKSVTWHQSGGKNQQKSNLKSIEREDWSRGKTAERKRNSLMQMKYSSLKPHILHVFRGTKNAWSQSQAFLYFKQFGDIFRPFLLLQILRARGHLTCDLQHTTNSAWSQFSEILSHTLRHLNWLIDDLCCGRHPH